MIFLHRWQTNTTFLHVINVPISFVLRSQRLCNHNGIPWIVPRSTFQVGDVVAMLFGGESAVCLEAMRFISPSETDLDVSGRGIYAWSNGWPGHWNETSFQGGLEGF